MKCPKCQFENQDDAKFCNQCAGKLEIACPSCGTGNLPGSRFCKECAHDLSLAAEQPRKDLSFEEKSARIQRYLPEGLTEKILSQRDRIEGERKQVTVMFCDMEGFTSLTERLGPEEAYLNMDQVYEILIHKVHDYEGTVNEMTGDGIVALFGAPIALEDAPQRAIRSGMAIHREMVKFSEKMRKEKPGSVPIKMRIGIHTGPVVVGTLGNDLRVEFKAVGDTVNLAARMEKLAEPGTTYVTEETFKLTEGLFRFELLGEKKVKGRSGSANVYQVIAPSTRRTRFDVSAERGLSSFVGRERELELLRDGFTRTKMGRGQAFSIVGEAGVGKSRLLYEFRKAVVNEEVTFLEGKSLSYSRGIAYHPIIDILKSNFDIKEGDDAFEIVEKVREGLSILKEDEANTLPSLLELLSVEQDSVETTAIAPEGKIERTIQALKRIFLKGSEIRPLIMAFEDLHWADRSSEDVLKSLLESIPGAKVLLLFTYRPEFVVTWGAKSYHSQLNLNRLSNRESLVMVTHILGTEEIERDLEELILEKTEGVPFFIEEFVQSLRDLRIIEKRDSSYRLIKDVQEITIPSTVQEVIMARIDSLPEGAKEVLQTGAVIDREFSYELLKTVMNLPDQELISRLSGLKDAELLYERGIYPKSTYTFKHALTQEVAYGSLLLRTRKGMHERIGQAIEQLYPARSEEYSEILAYHFSLSDNVQKALEYLGVANQKTTRASAMKEAEAYFEKAMELLDALPEDENNRERRISLLANQSILFQFLLKMPEYHDLLLRYSPVAAELDSPELVGAFHVRLGLCQWTFGQFDQAIQTLTKAAEFCEAANNPEEAGFAYMLLQWSHFYKGDYGKALALKQDILRKMEQQFNLRTYLRAFEGASLAYSWRGHWEQAIEEAEKALQLAQEFSDGTHVSFAAFIVSLAYNFKGDWGRAIEYGEMAVDKARTPGNKAFAQAMLASALCRSGEPEKGVRLLAEVVPMFRAAHATIVELQGTVFLAEGYWLTGNYDMGQKISQEALELAARCKARPFLASTHRVLGEIALQTNIEKAVSHFEQAISIAGELRAENDLALAYSGMGRYYKQKGDATQAREYLNQALEIFERLGTLLEPEKVREELAELA